MEMILHGQRIATNGDVRLMPTPEQWDLVATLKGRQADKANSRLTASLAFPSFDVSYALEIAAEPGVSRSASISTRAATAEACRPRGIQLGIPALDLHGQDVPGGRSRPVSFRERRMIR